MKFHEACLGWPHSSLVYWSPAPLTFLPVTVNQDGMPAMHILTQAGTKLSAGTVPFTLGSHGLNNCILIELAVQVYLPRRTVFVGQKIEPVCFCAQTFFGPTALNWTT